ncbi:MAG TPA: 30S ribosomal protein S20 [Candidatus Methylacidiphilales bacterium]
MANTRSAAKQARKSSRLRLLNKKAGDELRQEAKKIKNLVKEGKKDEATALLKSYQSKVDKASKKGRLKKNTAARRTSRIAKLVKTEVKIEVKAKKAPTKKKPAKKAAAAE